MKKVIAALFAGAMLLTGVACDDAPSDPTKVDEDDRRIGPGDGVDEVGPFR